MQPGHSYYLAPSRARTLEWEAPLFRQVVLSSAQLSMDRRPWNRLLFSAGRPSHHPPSSEQREGPRVGCSFLQLTVLMSLQVSEVLSRKEALEQVASIPSAQESVCLLLLFLAPGLSPDFAPRLERKRTAGRSQAVGGGTSQPVRAGALPGSPRVQGCLSLQLRSGQLQLCGEMGGGGSCLLHGTEVAWESRVCSHGLDGYSFPTGAPAPTQKRWRSHLSLAPACSLEHAALATPPCCSQHAGSVRLS